MPRIATFVFFDTETTGLPCEENNRTKIVELSMVAVQRDHIIEQSQLASQSEPIVRPRVLNKLTLCLNPRKPISDIGSQTSGLTNDLLEHQAHFNQDVVAMLDSFLKVLPKPVCIVAHNGHAFDFPIFKTHLEKIEGCLPADLLFVDSLYGLYDIEGKEKNDISSEGVDEMQPLTSMQAANETTPTKRKVDKRPLSGRKRRLYYEGNPKPKLKYTLCDVYERIVSQMNVLNAHRAEDDCLMLLEIVVKMGNVFLEWCDENCCSLDDIKALTPGVRAGD